MMRCLQRNETDPYFNLAAEEYILQNAVVDTFMIWRNDASIIVGKHQNANKEVCHSAVLQLNLPVIRRITGGGTVYHDLGNINFSFVRLNRKDNPVDFKVFTQPIIIFLKSMGLEAEFEGKSNITIQGLKISGNSAHVFKGRVLHHGTLLFDSNLDTLNEVLSPDEEKYLDRSVKSIRKKVTNISSHIQAEMSVHDFMESFFSFIINFYQDAYHDHLTKTEYSAIRQLVWEKYSHAKWNVGYSPDYQYSESWQDGMDPYKITITTKEAVIERIRIDGPEKHTHFLKKVEEHLSGTLHEKKSIEEEIKKINFASEVEAGIISQILDRMF